MIVPAIDLLGGKVVRLHRGDYDAATVYDDDPVARARRFRAEGAERLHVVDLDGARAGRCVQSAIIRAIVEAFGAGVQVGGGVRSREAFESYVACGAERVVLGTAALRDREMVRALCKDFPSCVIVADALPGATEDFVVEGFAASAAASPPSDERPSNDGPPSSDGRPESCVLAGVLARLRAFVASKPVVPMPDGGSGNCCS